MRVKCTNNTSGLTIDVIYTVVVNSSDNYELKEGGKHPKGYFEILPEYINVDGWLHPEYAKRIIAPIDLVLDDTGLKFYNWFRARELPIERVGNYLHCYCHSIAPEHEAVVASFGNLLTVEDKPQNP
jgi:hypothetical protein